jgi:glutaredoxin
MANVKVYGAEWCGMTRRTLNYLDSLGVDYEYVDVDDDKAASEWVKKQNGGKEKKPTLDICGNVITTPSNTELEQALRTERLLA